MDIVSRKAREGETVLAIDTGMTAKAFSHSRVQQSLTKPGYMISADGTVSEWLAMGTMCDDDGGQDRFGRIFAYGPDFEGSSLVSQSCGDDRERAWGVLHRCVSAIRRASLIPGGQGDPEGAGLLRAAAEAGPGAIFCGDDGSVLILPPELYLGSLSSHGEAHEAEARLKWTLQRTADPGRALSFMTGALAYRIIAGREPFDPDLENEVVGKSGSNPTESLSRIVNAGSFMPLGLERPELREAVSTIIDGMITPSHAASVDTLLAFGPDYDSLFDPAGRPSTEDSSIRQKKELFRKRIEGRIRKDDFFRKHRRTLIISGISAVLLGIVSFTWMSDVLSRPTTVGLEPDEVVAGYYRAIEELNQEIPGAYTARSVQTDYDTLTTTMYVTSRVRSNYEMKTGLISPALLFARGDPGLFSVYGITGLATRELARSDASAIFGVSFHYWIPVQDQPSETVESGQDTVKGEPFTVYLYRDTVELEYRKDRWLITRIVPDERTVIAVKDDVVNALENGGAAGLSWAPDPESIHSAAESIGNPGP